jgi:hypothetical protein
LAKIPGLKDSDIVEDVLPPEVKDGLRLVRETAATCIRSLATERARRRNYARRE